MLEIKPINDSIKFPTKAYQGDAGWDVYSPFDFVLRYNNRIEIPLGFIIIGKPGMVYKIEGKSSLAKFHGIDTIGNVIDNNYRGEVHVILINHGPIDFYVAKGMKIAQLLIQHVSDDNQLIINKDPLDITNRGSNGFGSTGSI